MNSVHRLARLAVTTLVSVGALATIASAAGASTAPTNLPSVRLTLLTKGAVPATGGTVRIRIADSSTSTCIAQSYPSAAGWSGPIQCRRTGTRVRSVIETARVAANAQAFGVTYAFDLAAFGVGRSPAAAERSIYVRQAASPLAPSVNVPSSAPEPTTALNSVQPTPTLDWVPSNYQLGMYGNVTLGDCTLAAVADDEQLQQKSATPLVSQPFIAKYGALADQDGENPGGPSSGIPMQQVLQAWAQPGGIDGSTITSWQAVSTDRALVTAALEIGPVFVSMNLPNPSYTTSEAGNWLQSWSAASPPGGYATALPHVALAVGFDDTTDSVVLATWGAQLEVSWPLFEQMVTGAWSVAAGPAPAPVTLTSTDPDGLYITAGTSVSVTVTANQPVNWSTSLNVPTGLTWTVVTSETATLAGTASLPADVGGVCSNFGVTATSASSGDAGSIGLVLNVTE